MLHLLLSTALILQPTAAPPGYIVGPQDRLSVTVYGESDLTRTVTVDGDGTFDFPLIGRVKAAGLPLRAIEQQLTARLKNGLYVNPQVSIEVESYRSQVVYVTGEVRTPGAVPLSGNMSVMDALARAGSPTAAAGTYVVINRRPRADEAASRPGGQPESEKVSMAELLSGRAQSILLSDGDTIFVPKAETFYVTGYVKHPGPYLLSSEVTIAQAVAMAGGITERGSRNRFRVTRTVEGKQAVLKNVKPGDLVRPGDSIEVLPRFF